eukprot:9447915-Pyramimonas_sp.AAC.1
MVVSTKSSVNGTDLHSSRTLAYHKEFGNTVCLACGCCVTTQTVRKLANVCTPQLNQYGRRQLRKVQQRLPPGSSKFAQMHWAQKKALR